MKEYLHLFTRVSEWNPKEVSSLEKYICLNDKGEVCFCNYSISHDYFHDFKEVIHVTHVLDLSKLTTKERAKKAVECGMVHDDERVKSEGLESLVNEAIKEL